MGTRFTTLSIAVDGDAPPHEFRIFAAGVNATENGYSALFDETAARAVMAAYERHGVDRMVDLEHLSIDQDARHYDPDARGWAKLEVRPDAHGAPELWAVEVTWTPDGAARLTDKRQRYVSPAFLRDGKTGRVTELINLAIVAMPATRRAEPLIAASINGAAVMNKEQVQAVIDAIKNEDVEGAIALLEAMLLGSEDAAGSEDAEEMQVAAASLLRLTTKATHAAALTEVEAWRVSHVALEAERAKLAADRAVLDSAERRRLVIQLVTCGARKPVEVWERDSLGAPDGKTPAAEYASMSLERLRALAALNAGQSAQPPRAPASGGVGAHGLTERELRICRDEKCDPATFAMLKARRAAAVTT